MDRVATLTLNPAIDSACEAEAVVPTRKVRTFGERYDPGGGGINVARVLARLEVEVEAIYLAGGVTGALLAELLAREPLACRRIAIEDHTRMSLAVFERSTGREYRFVPEGPRVAPGEWQEALHVCEHNGAQWLVASGSLPRGVPADFLARLAERLAPCGRRLVVDCSGEALKLAVEAGGLYLVKPSMGEFEALTGRSFASREAVAEAAMGFVSAGKVAIMAVTMGHRGAVLAHAGGCEVLDALPVPVRSATGAGDSFLAGMVHGLVRGESAALAFRRGQAAGAATVLSPGTGLCDPADIERLLATMAPPPGAPARGYSVSSE